jgi:hypothetical protein
MSVMSMLSYQSNCSILSRRSNCSILCDESNTSILGTRTDQAVLGRRHETHLKQHRPVDPTADVPDLGGASVETGH